MLPPMLPPMFTPLVPSLPMPSRLPGGTFPDCAFAIYSSKNNGYCNVTARGIWSSDPGGALAFATRQSAQDFASDFLESFYLDDDLMIGQPSGCTRQETPQPPPKCCGGCQHTLATK